MTNEIMKKSSTSLAIREMKIKHPLYKNKISKADKEEKY